MNLLDSIYSDQLTNIPNRLALMEHIKEIDYGNVFLLNIDNFNNVNSAYGFEIGDNVLVEIAKLINIAKPSSSKLFRMNADEFVLVSKEVMNIKELGDAASSIISFFDQMEIFIDKDIDIKISLSIGIAIGNSNTVLTHARIAIKELREHKRASYKIYDPKSTFLKKQKENIYWIHKIKKAFEDERLIAYFQPIVNNKTKKIEKYECLVRIIDEGVLIPPIRFMEASKLTGTLSLVTRVMIEHGFKKFSNTNYDFSINITNTDFYLNYLEDYLLKYAKKYNINPSRVTLEILEDISTLDTGETLSQLESLRYHGFKIAIDDFGSQSSNFSRLLEFSPDYLKIDGSFIKNILTDNKSLIIVEAIVLLCKKSDIKIVAEYVHNKDVQDKIEQLGIDYSQGYHFGEPRSELIHL
jgi:diguanylate cyclase (GGDEF)-like protein